MSGKRILFAAAVALTAMLTLGAAPTAVSAPVQALDRLASQEQSRTDQSEARREMRAGRILTIREIEGRVLPRMQGYEYLRFDYDSTAYAYRLKFIKDGRVTYIDVDARTGRIINRSN
ncbi:MAG: PepSY domain-containing protein [Pseudomonadota bacterium]